jgi:predicted short-subunit dehydrogenase-like oxidoreductase (DUF2520 family)
MKTVSIIGAGNLGTALGAALAKKGFPIGAVSCSSLSSARESARLIGRGRPTTDRCSAIRDADVVFICVPDEKIGSTAEELASCPADWPDKAVFHTSGILPARILSPVQKKGATTGSFHPAQSFPHKAVRADAFAGIYFGLEGSPDALRMAHDIVHRLGGHSLFLTAKDKPAYHAACSTASNLLVAVLDMAASLLGKRGLEKEESAAVLLPLAERTLQNVKEIGIEASLTGPIARGDGASVKAHLRSLAGGSPAAQAYKSLGRIALELAIKKGLPSWKAKTLKKILEEK